MNELPLTKTKGAFIGSVDWVTNPITPIPYRAMTSQRGENVEDVEDVENRKDMRGDETDE